MPGLIIISPTNEEIAAVEMDKASKALTQAAVLLPTNVVCRASSPAIEIDPSLLMPAITCTPSA